MRSGNSLGESTYGSGYWVIRLQPLNAAIPLFTGFHLPIRRTAVSSVLDSNDNETLFAMESHRELVAICGRVAHAPSQGRRVGRDDLNLQRGVRRFFAGWTDGGDSANVTGDCGQQFDVTCQVSQHFLARCHIHLPFTAKLMNGS